MPTAAQLENVYYYKERVALGNKKDDIYMVENLKTMLLSIESSW